MATDGVPPEGARPGAPSRETWVRKEVLDEETQLESVLRVEYVLDKVLVGRQTLERLLREAGYVRDE